MHPGERGCAAPSAVTTGPAPAPWIDVLCANLRTVAGHDHRCQAGRPPYSPLERTLGVDYNTYPSGGAELDSSAGRVAVRYGPRKQRNAPGGALFLSVTRTGAIAPTCGTGPSAYGGLRPVIAGVHGERAPLWERPVPSACAGRVVGQLRQAVVGRIALRRLPCGRSNAGCHRP